MSVGSLEEIIDDTHGIVSSSVGPEYYVTIMSFVDKSQLEPGARCCCIIRILRSWGRWRTMWIRW